MAKHYTRAWRSHALATRNAILLPLFARSFPFPWRSPAPERRLNGVRAIAHQRQPGNDMNLFLNRSLAGPQAPAVSITRDVIRIVITAVLAGTAFALLLALTVLSLTVIAPPAQASGAPTLASSEPVEGRSTEMEAPAKQDAGSVQLAAQAVSASAPVSLPQQLTLQADARSRSATSSPALLYVLLAIGAGLLALFVYSLAKRKS